MEKNILLIKTLNPKACGFFSCCTQILQKLCEHISRTKKYPDWYNSSELFVFYKNKEVNDIPYGIFDTSINIDERNKLLTKKPFLNIMFQYKQFSTIDFNSLTPMINVYFKPNDKVINTMNELQKKYSINYENTIAMYYRGTDKKRETTLGTKEIFEEKLLTIINENNNKKLKLLIQSDCQHFIDYFKEKYPDLIFINENLTSYKNHGIHVENKNTQLNYEKMFYLLATFLIISKSKYYICNSSNCSLWMSLYRGHGNNIYQYLNGEWV